MRKIVFDLLYAQPLGGAQFHGGGEYIKSVFEALTERYLEKCELEVCYNPELFLDEWILQKIHEKNLKIHNTKDIFDICAVLNLISDKENCCFFTGMIYQYEHADIPKEILSVGVCHGLRPLEKGSDIEAWRYVHTLSGYKEIVRNSMFYKHVLQNTHRSFVKILSKFKVIVTVSQHSAFSIRLNFPELMPVLDLRVFYTPMKYSPVEQANMNSEGSYILLVSGNRWLKNSYRAVMALDDMYQKGVLSGIRVRVYGDFPDKLRKKIKCKENFDFYGYVSASELEEAYRECKVFFYPTLNEGFGLPPLEAMKYGKTCVISAVSSLPEIYGESVYYCNPYDRMEMQNRIMQAVTNPINMEIISRQVKHIQTRQNEDLNKLCLMLIAE